MLDEQVRQRAALHAALSDPHRLAIVDELSMSDRSPKELKSLLCLESNLVAHHLNVLEGLGLISRVDSQGDGRRRYVHLDGSVLDDLLRRPPLRARRVIFVCTENAARSILAAAIWNGKHEIHALSGGTRPAAAVHPLTLETAARLGLDLGHATPRSLGRWSARDLVVTVCDRAHEALAAAPSPMRLHWSVPDPVASRRSGAFDRAAETIASRIDTLAPRVAAA